ncbi:trypsin-like peptidase domain-containing protein [Pseudidiomarina salilacus]|uniref:trypsin-like peptidase domain-containing protein n=1 Tax=Pseudidiomarina salilacus TaxID=3384452 RepID=UPI003984E672
MFHEPPKQFLYSAYKLEVEFQDDCGTIKTGTATAFILEVAESTPWIVTNRHVIDLNYKQDSAKYKNFKLVKLSMTGRRADDSVYTLNLHPNARVFTHDDEENDVALIEARIYLYGNSGFHWHFGMEHLATEEILKSVEPFDLVCYAGFPQQHDKLGKRPIIRSGHIASDPQYDYSWDGKPRGQCVAYEGFSSAGSSGSPVFAPPRGMQNISNSRNGYLIGVNAGHIPDIQGHSGISYFYKSTAILEIIKKFALMESHV